MRNSRKEAENYYPQDTEAGTGCTYIGNDEWGLENRLEKMCVDN